MVPAKPRLRSFRRIVSRSLSPGLSPRYTFCGGSHWYPPPRFVDRASAFLVEVNRALAAYRIHQATKTLSRRAADGIANKEKGR